LSKRALRNPVRVDGRLARQLGRRSSGQATGLAAASWRPMFSQSAADTGLPAAGGRRHVKAHAPTVEARLLTAQTMQAVVIGQPSERPGVGALEGYRGGCAVDRSLR